MAMLASKAPRPTPGLGMATQSSQYPHGTPNDYRSHRTQPPSNATPGVYASPTESNFSERSEGPDAVRHWNEDQVGDWLRRISCAQYIELFKSECGSIIRRLPVGLHAYRNFACIRRDGRKHYMPACRIEVIKMVELTYIIAENNISGEILMEMDQPALKEMGIKKIGDRVRIGSQAKLFRNREYTKAISRSTNRESLALLDTSFTTHPAPSPRPLHSARSAVSSRSEKRLSRQFTGADLSYAHNLQFAKSPSRPSSPLVDGDARSLRARPYGAASPKENPGKELGNAYFGHSGNAPAAPRYPTQNRGGTPQTARFPHAKSPSNIDASVTNSGILPMDKSLIRVIFDGGRSSVVNIDSCKNAEEIILKTLKKGGLNEAHVKNYCFYILEGIHPNPAFSRRISDAELVRMCNDRTRVERGRLILRKVHAGEPDTEQLKTAANVTAQQRLQENVNIPSNPRSASKVEQVFGESLAPVSFPLSPTSQQERERHIHATAHDLERPTAQSPAARARKLKDFYGARPPSELIASDLTSYFPDVEKGEIDKTIRMSVRRSRRISRAASRLSTASNISFASSLKDAPPLPTIADTWLKDGNQRPIRPLSVVRLGLPQRSSTYRESVTSSVLEPLEEESPVEPNRKSYVSFGGESGSDTLAEAGSSAGVGTANSGSYFDDGSSSIDPGDSINKRLSQALAEDDEGSDQELTEYLEADSWENVKYMKGALIGQGSFGSVYLALHAVTGELMAVKQVDAPSAAGTPLDSKRLNMVEALKHEIGLLRDLKHPNIVQYLGSNSDDAHLNIFLEYVPGGSVATMLVNYGPLGEGLIANFVRQILNGLAYLHSKDIIHRDIKGANILVDNKGSVKISDFGISKRIETSTLLHSSKAGEDGFTRKPMPSSAAANRVSMQGSVFWMAPEVVQQTAYTRKADIWSLGCLIVEMFTGAHPHPNCTQLQAIFKIGGGRADDVRPKMPDAASEDAKRFLRKTFEIDHLRRPTADELLLSPFCNPRA